MFVQQNQYTIEKIINRIRSGRLALPEFQRDFVWTPSQVADLLESVSREWPIGSLLLLKGPQPFAFRAIDSAPPVEHSGLDMYVLDGQQRVTALYHAIQDVSPFVYFVDFNKLTENSDEVISWDRRKKFERKFPNMQSRASAGIALVKDFWENKNFHDWLDLNADLHARNEIVAFRERRLAGLQAKVYHLLAIELDQEIELEALAKIFETLNKTGVRLNAFDLLVAKLYPVKFNLRERWDGAQSNSPLYAAYEPDGLEVIKLISLLVRQYEGRNSARGVRQGDVLGLSTDYVKRYWDKAEKLYREALRLLPLFGVNVGSSVPSWSMVLGVAACLERGYARDQIKRWWVNRIAKQTFAQAANTRIVSEFDAIFHGDMEIQPISYEELSDISSLSARSNGLLLRGLTGLVVTSGAVDPFTGKPLSDVKIEYCELSKDAGVKKISQSTEIRKVIFASEEGFRRFRKDPDLPSVREFKDAIASQGIDFDTEARGVDYLEAIFQ